jgi:hypothetical protein
MELICAAIIYKNFITKDESKYSKEMRQDFYIFN